jgi:hypothetical protein
MQHNKGVELTSETRARPSLERTPLRVPLRGFGP